MTDISHNFIRDTNSKALINTNKSAFLAYKESRNKRNKNLNDITDLKKEVNDLRIMVEDLKTKITKLTGEG